MIGLKRGIVKLVKNRPEWKSIFEIEKQKLLKVFKEGAVDIQHIGSTAVLSIYAKPIIDIGIIVKSFSVVKKYLYELEKLGYILKNEKRKDRMFFAKGQESRRTQYLHIGESGSGYIENMILFRDYLIKNESVAKEYEKLKKNLASQHSGERNIYTTKKEKFIVNVLSKIKSS
jgi:GrpB-like predicted nucleotidyltransferase (UPF0157 family)